MFKKNSRFQISTPSGFKDFIGVQEVCREGQIEIGLENDTILKCSPNHRVSTIEGMKLAKNIVLQDMVETKYGHFPVIRLDSTSGVHSFYDIVGVEDGEFYANTVRTHNCDFVGSSDTLISASKISSLHFLSPISSTPEGLDIYIPPEKDHIYTLTVDSARGEGLDYHAFSVIDSTKTPYVQVAKFRNNTISHQLLPTHIKKVAEYYNEAYVLVELNDLGEHVASILARDLEYANMIMVSSKKNNGGQSADGGFGGSKPQHGVRMSHVTKKTGCSVLRDMVEGDKLQVFDFDTISEFSTYTLTKNSYAASEGFYDDLVSSLVLFAWLTTQQYFKDYTDTDIRQRLFEDTIRKIEEAILPFGFISDGLEPEDDGLDVFDDRTKEQKIKDEEQMWKS